MIDRDRPSALRLFFVWRGSIVAHILPQILGFALYASIVVAATDALGLDLSQIGVAPCPRRHYPLDLLELSKQRRV